MKNVYAIMRYIFLAICSVMAYSNGVGACCYNPTPITTLTGLSNPVSLAFNPTTNCLAVANFGVFSISNGNVMLYTTNGDDCSYSPGVILKSGINPYFVAFNPTTNCLAVASAQTTFATIDYLVQIYALSSDNCTYTPMGDPITGIAFPQCIAFNSNTNCLAIADNGNNRVLVYAMNADCTYNTTPITTITGISPASVAFNPTTNCLAVANSNTRSIEIYAGDGDCNYSHMQTLSAQNSITPNCVTFNSSTNCLAFVGAGTVPIYSTNGAECTYDTAVTTIPGFTGTCALAFNPTTNCLAVANVNTVELYSMNDEDCSYTTIPVTTLTGFTLPNAVAFNATTNCLAVANSTGGNTKTGTVQIYAPGIATAINSQPTDAEVCTGSSANFAVTAVGTNVTYQWYFNSTAIAGATSSTYTIPSVTSSDAGAYSVVVTGACNAVTSGDAVLVVDPAPTITTQPTHVEVCAGNSATFAVTADGINIAYQWYFNNVAISGATNSTYTIDLATVANVGTYYVIVSGSCGSVQSNNVTLTVDSSTTITMQPIALTELCAGSSLVLSVAATFAVSYQWYFNGTAIAGATSSTYTIPSVASSDEGDYSVIVTGKCNTVTSDDAILVVDTSPTITTQPSNAEVCLGNSVAFSVLASSTDVTYQWYVNGATITGATNATYEIPSAALSDAGTYTVAVTGACGTATSDDAVLVVDPIPQVGVDASETTIAPGQSVVLVATPSGGKAPYTFIWSDGLTTLDAQRIVTPIITTNYSVTIIDAKGCHSDPSIPITIVVATANTSPLAAAIAQKYC